VYLGSPQFSSFYFLSNWRVFLGGEKRDIYIYIYIYIYILLLLLGLWNLMTSLIRMEHLTG
jgi:hypothetical protein